MADVYVLYGSARSSGYVSDESNFCEHPEEYSFKYTNSIDVREGTVVLFSAGRAHALKDHILAVTKKAKPSANFTIQVQRVSLTQPDIQYLMNKGTLFKPQTE